MNDTYDSKMLEVASVFNKGVNEWKRVCSNGIFISIGNEGVEDFGNSWDDVNFQKKIKYSYAVIPNDLAKCRCGSDSTVIVVSDCEFIFVSSPLGESDDFCYKNLL